MATSVGGSCCAGRGRCSAFTGLYPAAGPEGPGVGVGWACACVGCGGACVSKPPKHQRLPYGFRRLGVTHTQVTPGCDPGDRQRPPGPCKVTGAPEGGRLSESPRDWLGCASVRPRHARMPSRRRQQHCAIRRLGGRLKRRAPLPDFSGGRSLLASPTARTHPHSLIPRPLALSPSQRWRSGGRQGTVVGTKESRAPSTRRRARYTRGSSCVAAFQSCAVAPVGYP